MLPAKTPWRASVKLTTCSKSGTLEVPNNVESMVQPAFALATPGYPNFLFAVRSDRCNCRAAIRLNAIFSHQQFVREKPCRPTAIFAARMRQFLPVDLSAGLGKILLPRCVSVLPQLSAQRANADAESFGCLRTVSVELSQGGFNQPAFDFFERGN